MPRSCGVKSKHHRDDLTGRVEQLERQHHARTRRLGDHPARRDPVGAQVKVELGVEHVEPRPVTDDALDSAGEHLDAAAVADEDHDRIAGLGGGVQRVLDRVVAHPPRAAM